jgi:hypothetical protein
LFLYIDLKSGGHEVYRDELCSTYYQYFIGSKFFVLFTMWGIWVLKDAEFNFKIKFKNYELSLVTKCPRKKFVLDKDFRLNTEGLLCKDEKL